MAKGIEYFIANRTSRDEKRGGGGVMMSVARIAVGLSIAVMIITLAVIIGFKREIESKLTQLSGQLFVTSVGGGDVITSNRAIMSSEELEQIIRMASEECGAEIVRIAPYISRGMILRSTEAIEGVVVKGVDASFDRELFEHGLVDGVVPKFGEMSSGRNAIISKILADEMRLEIGDKLELLTIDSQESTNGSEGEMANDNRMRRDLYRVGAIYTHGMGDSEKHVIITDIRNTRRLNNFESTDISGYEVWFNTIEVAPSVADRINYHLLMSSSDNITGVASYAAQSLYPSIFGWLSALDINALVIIVIMLIVATFNITTAMLILVLERTQLIGLLKVLGMNNSSIRRIFLYRALSIATWGMLWGNGVAIILCLLQQHFDIVKLDEAGYMLSSVPISLSINWIVLLNVAVAVMIALLVIVPTRMVSRVEPSRAIKFE